MAEAAILERQDNVAVDEKLNARATREIEELLEDSERERAKSRRERRVVFQDGFAGSAVLFVLGR